MAFICIPTCVRRITVSYYYSPSFFLLFSFFPEHEKPATQQAKYIIECTSCTQWILAQSEVFQAEARREMIHTLYVLLLLAIVTVSGGRTLLSSLIRIRRTRHQPLAFPKEKKKKGIFRIENVEKKRKLLY